MTVEDHLRLMLGDQLLKIAQLAAENDALHAKLKELEPKSEASPTGGHGHPRQE